MLSLSSCRPLGGGYLGTLWVSIKPCDPLMLISKPTKPTQPECRPRLCIPSPLALQDGVLRLPVVAHHPQQPVRARRSLITRHSDLTHHHPACDPRTLPPCTPHRLQRGSTAIVGGQGGGPAALGAVARSPRPTGSGGTRAVMQAPPWPPPLPVQVCVEVLQDRAWDSSGSPTGGLMLRTAALRRRGLAHAVGACLPGSHPCGGLLAACCLWLRLRL